MEKQIIEIEGKKYEVTLVPVEEVKEVEPKRISGFYVTGDARLIKISDVEWDNTNKNTFRTKEQAEACIAMAQLSQLMFEANEGLEPSYKNESQIKHVIYFLRDVIHIDSTSIKNCFLSFKTREIRDNFLIKNKDLILKAKPLL